MVSLRRRRLLGLCSGKSSIPVELPGSIENNGAISLNKNVNPFSIHPMPLISLHHEKPTNIHETSFGSSIVTATSSPKEETDNFSPGNDVKHRKRYRRKLYEDQEPCIMRGVYFKNMKWQAAIKVDKKQIHLGTVGSQEDAARLYDSRRCCGLTYVTSYPSSSTLLRRAAFMCGRQPNFELSEEEKRELSHYNWEEFLAITRNAINHKKLQRRIGGGRRKKSGIEMRSSDVEEPVRGTCDSPSISNDGKVEVFAS